MVWAVLKIRSLSTALMLLKQATSVKSTAIPSFIYKPVTKAPENSSFSFDFDLNLKWDHAIFVVGILTLLFVITLIIKLSKRKNGPLIYIEITSLNSYVIVPLMSLPICPSHCHITVPKSISNVEMTGSCLSSKLQIEWDKFLVSNALNPNPVQVPNKPKLTFLQTYKLKKLLKQPFFTYIHIVHNGLLMPITRMENNPYFFCEHVQTE